MATIYDVAKRAGVSITTVSRVINNYPNVKETTRQHVLSVLKEMSYIPNANAGNLVRKLTSTIAVLVPDITNSFFTTLVRGIEDKANERELSVILGNTDEEAAKEKLYINKFLERRFDGLIIVPVESRGKNLKAVQKQNLPLVIADRDVEGINTDFVSSDNWLGAQLLAQHLLELGHRDIALISGPLEISVFRERAQGFKMVLNDNNISIQDELFLYGPKPSKQVGYELTRKLLASDATPTAIFAGNNSLAIGVVLALQQAGIKVPRDISVTCFDDNDSSSTLDPFFTSVIQPAYMIGYMAAELLLKRLKNNGDTNPTRLILKPELITRHSTASPASSS